VADISISVTLDSPVPAYRQVVDQVRMHLVSGALAPGDPLPSVRSLAAQLGVHFNTIADAYRELASEGWIDLAHGKRAVVLPRTRPQLDSTDSDNLRQRLRAIVAELRLKGVPARTIERDVAEILKPEGSRS
jgi:GntR family transcriptional regulator